MLKQVFRLALVLVSASAISVALTATILAYGFDLHSHYLALSTAGGQPSLGIAMFMDVASPIAVAVEGFPESSIQRAAVVVSLVAFGITLWILWKMFRPILKKPPARTRRRIA